eukprot:6132880-Alexandrium_andersonii.AAC.1
MLVGRIGLYARSGSERTPQELHEPWSPEFKRQQIKKLESIAQTTSETAKLLQAFEPGTARAQERPQTCSQKLPR